MGRAGVPAKERRGLMKKLHSTFVLLSLVLFLLDSCASSGPPPIPSGYSHYRLVDVKTLQQAISPDDFKKLEVEISAYARTLTDSERQLMSTSLYTRLGLDMASRFFITLPSTSPYETHAKYKILVSWSGDKIHVFNPHFGMTLAVFSVEVWSYILNKADGSLALLTNRNPSPYLPNIADPIAIDGQSKRIIESLATILQKEQGK